jgi:hypothetical protein
VQPIANAKQDNPVPVVSVSPTPNVVTGFVVPQKIAAPARQTVLAQTANRVS